MTCIIVDDEPLAREGLELHIEEIHTLELVGQFGSAIRANEFLQKNGVDLIFLDIQMPGITGLQFLKTLVKKPMVILTTAYPEYAIQGFELDVVDYLVKPIRFERFLKAVNKAQSLRELRQEKTAPAAEPDHVYVKADRKFVRLHLNEIRYIEGMKDYVMIHTTDQRLMTAMNVKTILQQLPADRFARISKSFIINIKLVESVEAESVLIDGKELPLGKAYKDEFMEQFVKSRVIDK